MAKVLSEKDVKRAMRDWLFRNSWARNYIEKGRAEHGVDIKVRHNKYSRYFFIETKGDSKSKSVKSVREASFVHCLGQIITRMKTGKTRYYYGLGLPEPIAKIAIRRIPWQIAKKILLYVFSVDRNKKVKQYSWQDLKKAQTLKK